MADLSFYIDDETAVFVKEFCEKSGVDFNTLMVMYCKQIALQKKIPMSVGIIPKKQDPIGVNFDFIRKFDPEKLINVLSEEDDFITATVLSALPSYKSSLLLENIDGDRREKIVELMINGIIVSDELLEGIAKHLYKRLETLEISSINKIGGLDEFVKIMNLMNRNAERNIMINLNEKSPEKAEEIKKRMFVFEDIVLLDDRSVQKILRETDVSELAKALKWTDEAVKEKIFSNMSKKASDSLKSDMDFMGPVLQKDCDEAQLKIVSIIRRLEDCGEIVICRG